MRAPPVLALIAAAALAGGGYLYWSAQMAGRAPTGLASANGRIEVERVDIAAKSPGRVAEIRIKEGDIVAKGALIAQLDTAELLAQHAAAKASVQRATASIGRAEADIAIREAEHNLAAVEMRRASELEQRAAGTKAELDRRTAQHLVAAAQILGARAALAEAKAAKEAAEAQVKQIEATLDAHRRACRPGGRLPRPRLVALPDDARQGAIVGALAVRTSCYSWNRSPPSTAVAV